VAVQERNVSALPMTIGRPDVDAEARRAGGSVTRNGSPASNGIGRRRCRIGIRFGAIAVQSRSGGRVPIARSTESGDAVSIPLPRSTDR
jgi:hypothetical protein